MTPSPNRTARLTPVELVVALVVAVILLVIAAPMFATITTDSKLGSATSLLSGHMQLARNEAVKRGIPVTICPSGNAEECSGTAEWTLGWIVFQDQGTPGRVDGGDTVIAVSPSLGSDAVAGDHHTYIRYLPDGAAELR